MSSDEKILKLSQSRLSVINDCLGMYKMGYVDKLAVPKVVWSTTVFGDVIHEMIDQFLTKYQEDFAFAASVEKMKQRGKISIPVDRLRELGITAAATFERVKNEYKDKNTKIAFSRKFPEKDFLNTLDAWAPQLVKFVARFFDLTKKFENEKEFDVQAQELLETKFPVRLVGVYDHKREREIIDFKTTTKPERFFFIDWEKNNQSTMYACSFKIEEGRWPDSFSYVVFNVLENMIFVTSKSYSPKELESARVSVRDSVINAREKIEVCDDVKLWSPTQEKCTWCDYCLVCPASALTAKKNRQDMLKKIRI